MADVLTMLHAADQTAKGRKGDRPSRIVARPVRSEAAEPRQREDKTMGKVVIRIPLVTWRDGRPRYWPSTAQRKMGYKGEDLRHGAAGPWFTLDEAIAWSKARQMDIAERCTAAPVTKAMTKAGRKTSAAMIAPSGNTIAHLLTRWLDSPRFNGKPEIEGRRRREPLAANTVRYYRQGKEVCRTIDDGKFWVYPANAVTERSIEKLLHMVEVKHGLAQARCVRATLSRAFGFGRRAMGLRGNPIRDMAATLPVLPPRIRVAEPEHIDHLIAAADLLGRPEIGDSIMLGVCTAQRQNDRLALQSAQMTPDGILFRQAKKHGQPLLIPPLPRLVARLEAAKARRKDWTLHWPEVIVDETTKRPFKADWYRKVYREVRTAAIAGIIDEEATRARQEAWSAAGATGTLPNTPVYLLAPMPELEGFRDQDLRDTAVTWLAIAKCEKQEIAAITGHSLKTIDEIMRHYLGLHPELARSGIGKLGKWLDGRGR